MNKTVQIKLLQKSVVCHCISVCFDICAINIRGSIRVRGLHLVFFRPFGFSECLCLFLPFGQPPRYWDEYHGAAGVLWLLPGRELHDND